VVVLATLLFEHRPFRKRFGDLAWSCFDSSKLCEVSTIATRQEDHIVRGRAPADHRSREDEATRVIDLVSSVAFVAWSYPVASNCTCQVRLQRNKPTSSREEEAPRLIDIVGPVTGYEKAKHDFSWTQSIGRRPIPPSSVQLKRVLVHLQVQATRLQALADIT
jgi:hypothetical protein